MGEEHSSFSYYKNIPKSSVLDRSTLNSFSELKKIKIKKMKKII